VWYLSGEKQQHALGYPDVTATIVDCRWLQEKQKLEKIKEDIKEHPEKHPGAKKDEKH
jgi:hypothetical protein